MMKIILTVIVILLSLNTYFAQNYLSLSDAIMTGLKNNYDIRIVNKNLSAADVNNSWGTAGRFPSIDISVSSINRFDNTETNEITTNNITPSVQLNWVLFNGFRIYNTKRKLEDLYDLSGGNSAIVVENTIQSIILAYFDVLLDSEKLKVFEEVEILSKDRYDRTLLSKDIGGSVSYEVLQAKNSWLEDRTTYLTQKMNLDISFRRLNLLLGVKEDKKYEFLDEFETELFDYDINDLKSKMMASNKTLKNQYINELITEREIDLARGDIYPTLSLSSGYDYVSTNQKIKGFPESKTNSYDYYANLNLSMNLFNGLNTKRSIEIAKIEHEISKIETEHIIHSLIITLNQLLDLYNVQKELLNVTEENLEAAKLNLQISEEKYRNGSINSFNYRDIQIIFLNASIQRLNAIYNLKQTDTELARLTGSIINEENNE